jgi:hypothetical protein
VRLTASDIVARTLVESPIQVHWRVVVPASALRKAVLSITHTLRMATANGFVPSMRRLARRATYSHRSFAKSLVAGNMA